VNGDRRKIEAKVREAASRPGTFEGLNREAPLRGFAYFDRRGHEISPYEWNLLLQFPNYRQVAETLLDDGRVRVSTVWLGLDHSSGRLRGAAQAPPIFETLVFEEAGGEIVRSLGEIQYRYRSEADALEGHEYIVAEVEVWLRAIGIEGMREQERE